MENSKQAICLCAHCKKKLYLGDMVFWVQRFDMDAPGGPDFIRTPTCSTVCAIETKDSEVAKWREIANKVSQKGIKVETI